MTDPNTSPAIPTPNADPDPTAPEHEPLGEVVLRNGARISLSLEWWPGRPPPSLRIDRCHSDGARRSSFAMPARLRRGFVASVLAWDRACADIEAQIADVQERRRVEGATRGPSRTSQDAPPQGGGHPVRQEAADARLEAEQARRGGR